MKKTVLLFALLVSSPAWGATYYVSPTGSNTSPYDTWAKAANLPETAIAAGSAVAGPHTAYIAPGIYSSYLLLTDSDWIDGSIIGTASIGTIAPAAKGQVIISTTAGQIGLYTTRSGITVRNVSITGTDATHDALFIDGANFTGSNLYVYKNGRYNVRTTANATGFALSSIVSRASRIDAVVVANYLMGSGTISYSIFDDADTYSPTASSDLVNMAGTGTINFYNCVMIGARGNTFTCSGTGVANLTNNVILAGIWMNNYTIYRSAGTVNLTNNYLGMGFGNLHGITNGTINTDTGNIKNGSKNFIRYKRSGFIIPSIDDAAAIANAEGLETELAARGMKGTFAVEAANFAGNQAALQAMHARGVMEIAVHSYSHSDLSLTGNAFSISKASHTVNIDRANDQIVVSGAAPVTVTGFKTKTITAIRTELMAGGCTCGSPTTNLSGNTFGEVLADSAGAQASPYTTQLLIDATGATGYFNVEVVQAKAIAEEQLGATITTFATPFGATSSNLEACVKAAGFTCQRNGISAADAEYNLSTIDLYQLSFLSSGTFINADDQNLFDYTHAIAQAAAHSGGIFALLTHTGEATQAQWAAVLDVLSQYPELTITSLSDAVNTIKTGGSWSTVDDRTYTRTWTDQANYLLEGSSLLVGAGEIITNIHDQPTPATDIRGFPVRTRPTIGAYHYGNIIVFDAAAPAGGNGTAARPYADVDEYDFTDPYAVREGAEIKFKSGTYGDFDISALAEKPEIKPSGKVNFNSFVTGPIGLDGKKTIVMLQ